MSQFQHVTQFAYLEQWKVGGKTFLFEKTNRRPKEIQSAKNKFGFYNFQSDAMERAFADVEQHIGYINFNGKITDPCKTKSFIRWVALHAVRNAHNIPIIGGIDYRTDVDNLEKHLSRHFGFNQLFSENILITGDNPVFRVVAQCEFWIAPLSPRRCLFLVPFDAIPVFKPTDINQLVCNASKRHCLSFDKSLHLP